MDDILQLGSTSNDEAILNDFDKTIVRRIQADIASAEAYQASTVEPTVKQRYEIYYADKDYYKNRFPILSKTSDLVSTDVADTIEWALPSLMKVFTGSDEVITIAGVTEEDDTKAETMQELLVYLQKFEPTDLKVASLLVKPGNMQVKLDIDYTCFEIPNDFIVGYGLDYDGFGRNLPAIYTVVEG